MELAADEINALGGATVGGKKYKVRVVSMDDRFQAALAPNPELLLLDEPAGGVNLEEVGVLIDLITRIRDSGVTICLIEHKMSMVMNISDRILALNYGKKVTEGTPAEVCRNEQVIKSYLGDKYAAARRSG